MESSDFEARTIRDVLEIQALKARYCAAVDQLPHHEEDAVIKLRSMFAEDMDGGSGDKVSHGREAVIDFLVRHVGQTHQWLWHTIHSPIIDVVGDSAKGQWTAFVFMMDRDSATVKNAIGRYFESYRRMGSGWHISSSRWAPESIVDVSPLWDSGRALIHTIKRAR